MDIIRVMFHVDKAGSNGAAAPVAR
jgi:hypothetical protein